MRGPCRTCSAQELKTALLPQFSVSRPRPLNGTNAVLLRTRCLPCFIYDTKLGAVADRVKTATDVLGVVMTTTTRYDGDHCLSAVCVGGAILDDTMVAMTCDLRDRNDDEATVMPQTLTRHRHGQATTMTK